MIGYSVIRQKFCLWLMNISFNCSGINFFSVYENEEPRTLCKNIIYLQEKCDAHKIFLFIYKYFQNWKRTWVCIQWLKNSWKYDLWYLFGSYKLESNITGHIWKWHKHRIELAVLEREVKKAIFCCKTAGINFLKVSFTNCRCSETWVC